MKLRLVPSGLLEWWGLRSGRAPLPLGDVWLAIFQARAIMAGVRLGVFEALEPGPKTTESVAHETNIQPEMAEMLLRVLTCTSYVKRKSPSRYTLTKTGRRFLTRESASGVTQLMQLMYFNLKCFDHLEEVLQSGRGLEMHALLDGDTEWGVYQNAMREAARLQAPLVARRVPMRKDAARLLDIGGSHGLFAAALCRRRSGMRADVLERPEAVGIASEIGRQEGLDRFVHYRAGDALHDELGSDYDVVLLSNVLHHFVPTQIQALLRKTYAATRVGGTVAIWDLERPPHHWPPDLIGDGMALLFRVTSGAGVYRVEDYTAWLCEAGFDRIRLDRVLGAPGQVLITGRS